MRQKDLIGQIRKAVSEGKVKIEFRSRDFICLEKSPAFLSKHAKGNGNYSEYFIRQRRGLYKLNN